MAKISELQDDLTGQLNQMGSGNGARTRSDPYMMQAMAGKPAGPVSPIPASASGASPPIPPTQMAMAPGMPSQSMAPPMDAAASLQQGMMHRAAMEGTIMRPPYSQPYGQAAYALSPGFQGAPVSALQAPVYSSMDSCAVSGPQLRATPAAQMQALQQHRMAQLQAQQQALTAQATAAQAGQQCLEQEEKRKKKANGVGGGLRAAIASEGVGRALWWVWLIIVIAFFALVIVGIVYIFKNHKELENLTSALARPVVV